MSTPTKAPKEPTSIAVQTQRLICELFTESPYCDEWLSGLDVLASMFQYTPDEVYEMLERQRRREIRQQEGKPSDDDDVEAHSLVDSMAELELENEDPDISLQSADSFGVLDDSALSVEEDSRLNESWSPISSDRSFAAFGASGADHAEEDRSTDTILVDEPSSIICDEIHELFSLYTNTPRPNKSISSRQMVTLLTGVDLRNDDPTHEHAAYDDNDDANDGPEESTERPQRPQALFDADATEEEISELPESDGDGSRFDDGEESSSLVDDPDDGDYVDDDAKDDADYQEKEEEASPRKTSEQSRTSSKNLTTPKRSTRRTSARNARKQDDSVMVQEPQSPEFEPDAAEFEPLTSPAATPTRRRLLSTKSTAQRKLIEDSLVGSDDDQVDENDAILQNRFQTPRTKRSQRITTPTLRRQFSEFRKQHSDLTNQEILSLISATDV
mmetsp:Transcript_34571/g.86860  ORF Transcript_34571/g.86860 Transcript_34571/m.86860 type:complete len:444 (-) Transcript_34571:41-1372(-)